MQNVRTTVVLKLISTFLMSDSSSENKKIKRQNGMEVYRTCMAS